MAQAAMVAGAAGQAFGALGALSKAKAEKQAADNNAYIGRTRALQTATAAADGLNSEAGTLRTTLAGNGQKAGQSTFGIFDEMRRVRGQERRIAFENEMQTSRDYTQQGRNAMSAGRWQFLSGMAKTGQSMFDIYQYRKNPTDG